MLPPPERPKMGTKNSDVFRAIFEGTWDLHLPRFGVPKSPVFSHSTQRDAIFASNSEEEERRRRRQANTLAVLQAERGAARLPQPSPTGLLRPRFSPAKASPMPQTATSGITSLAGRPRRRRRRRTGTGQGEVVLIAHLLPSSGFSTGESPREFPIRSSGFGTVKTREGKKERRAHIRVF